MYKPCTKYIINTIHVYIRFVDDKMNQFVCLNFTVNIRCSQFYEFSLLNSSFFFFFCRLLINNVVKRFCGGVRPPGLTCIHARVMYPFCSISNNDHRSACYLS